MEEIDGVVVFAVMTPENFAGQTGADWGDFVHVLKDDVSDLPGEFEDIEDAFAWNDVSVMIAWWSGIGISYVCREVSEPSISPSLLPSSYSSSSLWGFHRMVPMTLSTTSSSASWWWFVGWSSVGSWWGRSCQQSILKGLWVARQKSCGWWGRNLYYTRLILGEWNSSQSESRLCRACLVYSFKGILIILDDYDWDLEVHHVFNDRPFTQGRFSDYKE